MALNNLSIFIRQSPLISIYFISKLIDQCSLKNTLEAVCQHRNWAFHEHAPNSIRSSDYCPNTETHASANYRFTTASMNLLNIACS